MADLSQEQVLLISTAATIYAERRRENYDLSEAVELVSDSVLDAARLIAYAQEHGERLISEARTAVQREASELASRAARRG